MISPYFFKSSTQACLNAIIVHQKNCLECLIGKGCEVGQSLKDEYFIHLERQAEAKKSYAESY